MPHRRLLELMIPPTNGPVPHLIVDGNPEYLIERIMNTKCNCVRRKCQLLYHIKWAGYPISNNPSDWILANALDDEAGKLIAGAYHEQHSTMRGSEHLAKEREQRQPP